MTTQTLTATQFPTTTAARPRRLGRSSLTMFVLMALWVTGIVLALRGPAPAEPILLVLFGAGLIGAAGLMPRRAERADDPDGQSVSADGD
jgi:hypothetical protein